MTWNKVGEGRWGTERATYHCRGVHEQITVAGLVDLLARRCTDGPTWDSTDAESESEHRRRCQARSRDLAVLRASSRLHVGLAIQHVYPSELKAVLAPSAASGLVVVVCDARRRRPRTAVVT